MNSFACVTGILREAVPKDIEAMHRVRELAAGRLS